MPIQYAAGILERVVFHVGRSGVNSGVISTRLGQNSAIDRWGLGMMDGGGGKGGYAWEGSELHPKTVLSVFPCDGSR